MTDDPYAAMRELITDIADARIVAHEQARREAMAPALDRIHRVLDLAIRDAGGKITPLIQAVDNLVSLLEEPIELPEQSSGEQEDTDGPAEASDGAV